MVKNVSPSVIANLNGKRKSFPSIVLILEKPMKVGASMSQYFSIVKRDGLRVPFDVIKIVNAVQKAAWATGTVIDYQVIQQKVTDPIEREIQKGNLTVEQIQDMVELALMPNYPQVAKAYILYRDARTRARNGS
jgi:anaerobic ribonucleoside-triphosphate reductase